VRRTAGDLQTHLKKSGESAGKGWSEGFTKSTPKIEQAMKKVADATGKVRVEQAKYNEVLKDGDKASAKTIQQFERLSKAQRDHAAAVKSTAAEVRKANVDIGDSSRAAGMGLMELGGTLGALGRVAGPAGIAALVPALGALGGVAAAAAGSVALLPGAIGSAAAAFGTLKLATMGLDDAFKNMGDPEKFAESLKSLAPSAQQAILSIQQMMPALKGLQQATQNALFANMGPQLNQFVNTLLPTVQTLTTGIATGMNQMLSGVMNQLTTPETMATLQTIVGDITKAFQNLAPAAAPFTKALTDIIAVGASFLPDIAKGAADAAQSFSQFISEARQSGQLQEWLATGLDILKQMGPMALDLAKAFLSLAPIGERVMPLIAQSMKFIADIMPGIASVTASISPLFMTWENGIRLAATALGAMMPILRTVGGAVKAVMGGVAFLMGPEAKAQADLAGAQMDAAFGGTNTGYAGGTGSFAGSPTAGIPGVPAGGWQAPPSGIDAFGMPPKVYNNWSNTDPSAAGISSTSLPDAPAVPYAGIPALQPGLQPTAALHSAQTSVADAQTNLAEKEARVNQLRADNNATANDILNAENDAAKARREKQEADMRFAEAQKSAFQSQTKQFDQMSNSMGEIGAALDQDLGISDGLSGMADNLVRFLANLAAAPLVGQLSAIANANPNEGSGMMGMLAANGAFGSQYTPGAIAAQGSGSYSSSAMGPAALQPGAGFGGNVDSAIALAQSANGKPYTYGGSDLVNGLADCSGAISDLYEVITTGQSNSGRSFTTESDFGALGFKPGYMPGALNIGVHNGGGGKNSHMASTLPNGVNFESGGGGIQYGGGAAGALDPQFENRYHLPVGAASPSLGWAGPTGVPAGITGGAGESPVWGASPGMPIGTGAGVAAPGIGVGVGSAAGQPLGGQSYPAGPAGGGIGLNGMAMDGLMAATSGLDMLAPGTSAAAKIGIQLANRTAKYAGQVAGIGVSGLLDTITPAGDNPKASIGNSWFGKLAGGIAGASAALPNMAGGKPPSAPGQNGQAQPQQGGPVNQSVTVNNNHATEDMAGNQAARELGAMYSPAGRQ